MRDRICDLLEAKSDLPPLPDILIRLQKMVRDPGSNVKNIARLIEMDPVLAGRILKLANSTYYSRSTTRVKTLPTAITKIGLNMLVKLAYSLKLTTLFDDNDLLDNKQFWQHSLAVAIFTQSITRRVNAGREEADIAYLAGLMHDVGIVVFMYLSPTSMLIFFVKTNQAKRRWKHGRRLYSGSTMRNSARCS